MSNDIQKSMALISAALNAKFYLNDRFVSYEEVFSDTGLLPAITKRADQLCSLCLGYGLGATFDEAEDALLGTRVVFDDVTPNVLRLLCFTDVINELIQGGPSRDYTPLDELMYD
ncbi:type IV secretion protein IcmS [Legionella israelensis]|uniref:IcmS n=1 Tax=Legionella israelensis TaxID=454 RepID=Q49J17_9GAMM|nr:type IV secretion IcmS family protein [Legionella israelensis]AAX56259.1 IcmS [Legionella israelensis]KTD28725.1 protein IcmS [Legionella israelensis]QBR83235.1 type IV secretion protein IcmS [Legionella israelensis]QBS09388.1 type IV secretion protein IcmS [Legionella israelensis]QDP71764.1 type IV secretion protein IcmS [Legionella israelensis]